MKIKSIFQYFTGIVFVFYVVSCSEESTVDWPDLVMEPGDSFLNVEKISYSDDLLGGSSRCVGCEESTVTICDMARNTSLFAVVEWRRDQTPLGEDCEGPYWEPGYEVGLNIIVLIGGEPVNSKLEHVFVGGVAGTCLNKVLRGKPFFAGIKHVNEKYILWTCSDVYLEDDGFANEGDGVLSEGLELLVSKTDEIYSRSDAGCVWQTEEEAMRDLTSPRSDRCYDIPHTPDDEEEVDDGDDSND